MQTRKELWMASSGEINRTIAVTAFGSFLPRPDEHLAKCSCLRAGITVFSACGEENGFVVDEPGALSSSIPSDNLNADVRDWSWWFFSFLYCNFLQSLKSVEYISILISFVVESTDMISINNYNSKF